MYINIIGGGHSVRAFTRSIRYLVLSHTDVLDDRPLLLKVYIYVNDPSKRQKNLEVYWIGRHAVDQKISGSNLETSTLFKRFSLRSG